MDSLIYDLHGRSQTSVCVEKIYKGINVENVEIVHEPFFGIDVSCEVNIFLSVVSMDNEDTNP